MLSGRAALLGGLTASVGMALSWAARPPAPTATLCAVGDVLLARGVGRRIERYGTDWPFERVAPWLRATDLAFANMECALTTRGAAVPKPFVFRGDPGSARGLRDAGIDVVSLANNHTLDYGRTGLADTMDALRVAGVGWVGAGATLRAARRPLVRRVGALRVGFVAMSDFVPEGVFPRQDRESVARASERAVREAVVAARRAADVAVVSLHWGVEFRGRPSARQVALARAAAAGGADLVLGHHPHVLQPLEWLPGRGGRRTLAAYSLGNFVFDPRGAAASRTVILRCRLGRDGVESASVLPVLLRDCRPTPATGAGAQAILRRVAKLSAERGTRVVVGGGIGVVAR
ncbi:MAG: CapA family protein [Chthonomonadales bacterium]|nr:CapA family protein [Chthonomonadales bacterium]